MASDLIEQQTKFAAEVQLVQQKEAAAIGKAREREAEMIRVEQVRTFPIPFLAPFLSLLTSLIKYNKTGKCRKTVKAEPRRNIEHASAQARR